MAGTRRASQPTARTEGLHPGRVGRGGHVRHPAGEASRSHRGHHHQRRQRRAGREPRRRHRHRLQDTGLRSHPRPLRRGAAQPGRHDARQVAPCPEARWTADLHLRSTRPRLRGRDRCTLVREARPARRQRVDSAKRETPRSRLFVPLHAGERDAAHRDHLADRRRNHSPRSRQGLSVRIDERGHRLRRNPAAPRARSW